MENVLITGAAGLLGSNIAYILRSRANIIALDKNAISISGVTSICGSVLDLQLINKLMTDYKITSVIHCAALVNMDICEEDPNYADIINYVMTSNLAWLADKYSTQMIYISTDAVYPGNAQGLYKESDTTGPVSIYGKTKLLGENAVLQYKKNLVIRTNMYGFNCRDKESFGEWIINALKNNQELHMFYDLHFSPILVNRLVEILYRCIELKLSGLYNVCSTGSISKYDIACEIQRQFNLPGSIIRASMKEHKYIAPRTQNMGMDNSKIKTVLNIDIPNVHTDITCFKNLYDKGYPANLKGGK